MFYWCSQASSTSCLENMMVSRSTHQLRIISVDDLLHSSIESSNSHFVSTSYFVGTGTCSCAWRNTTHLVNKIVSSNTYLFWMISWVFVREFRCCALLVNTYRFGWFFIIQNVSSSSQFRGGVCKWIWPPAACEASWWRSSILTSSYQMCDWFRLRGSRTSKQRLTTKQLQLD